MLFKTILSIHRTSYYFMKGAFQLEGKLEVMEQGEGQSSGNEETAPYTVVVQIPNPYGDSSGQKIDF